MRKLTRGAEPTCLSQATGNWASLGLAYREDIRTKLRAMQGRLCAYCEGDLDALGQHIEHLWCRHQYPQKMFDWHNLFLSCDRSDSCGTFKDKKKEGAGPYNPADLVDPCVDDPDMFFQFRRDGRVEVREGLNARDHTRAEETIRVFNLNLDEGRGGRSLCAERRRVVDGYLDSNRGILEVLEGCEQQERDALIAAEIQATADQPFGTWVRHLFGR